MALRVWTIAVVLAAGSAICDPLIAAPALIADTADDAQRAGALKLTLDAGKAGYALYEPVVVTLRVSNPTDRAIQTSLLVRHKLGLVLSIQREGGNVEVYQSGLSSCFIRTGNAQFAAKTTDTAEIVAFYNDLAEHLAFPASGRYRLSASAQVWMAPNVLIESDPVWIEVREPSDLDKRAIESLGSTDRLVNLFRNGVKGFCRDEKPVETCGQSLRSVLSRFPESAYAPALTFYYGQALAAADLQPGGESESAMDVFNDFLRRFAGHPLEADVTAALIREVHDRGRREESLEWLHRFETKFPDRSSQLQELRARIE